LEEAYSDALQDFDIELEDLYKLETDEVGSVRGQWATSYLESLATLELPAWGYGLRPSNPQ